MTYVPFHIHTEYSLLDGAIKVKDLFSRLKDIGVSAVMICEHGNMAGTIKKYQLAKQYGIKLIMGMELYVVDDLNIKEKGDIRSHLVVIAKNLKGYKNLIKLASIAACDGFYYKPRVDKKTIGQYSEGLIATTACIKNDIAQAIIRGNNNAAKQLIKGYIDVFGRENFFLEVADHGIPEEKVVAEAYFKLAEEFNLKVVFGNDAHYLQREHVRAHDVCLCQPKGTMIKRFVKAKNKYLVYNQNNKKKWDNNDIDILRNNVRMSIYELSRILNRTIPSIRHKYNELGIVRSNKDSVGEYKRYEFENIPIEKINVGDKLLSWSGKFRRGIIIKRGAKVMAKSCRNYNGKLVIVKCASGEVSSYTHDHICIVNLKSELSGGNFITYLMRQGQFFRIGSTRYDQGLMKNGIRKYRPGGKNSNSTLGILGRMRRQLADDIWILSVHKTDADAKEHEEWLNYRYNIPTWQFPKIKYGSVGKMVINLWNKINCSKLYESAFRCLRDYGRDILYPFCNKNFRLASRVKPVEIRACNLLPGMRVCVPSNNSCKQGRTYDGSGAWTVIDIYRRSFSGAVYSIEVDMGIYVADGIVTHNCLQGKTLLSDPKRFKFSGSNYHVLTEQEAYSFYPGHPEVFSNTVFLVDSCDVELSLGKPIFPGFSVPIGETNDSYLKKLCYKGFREKYGHNDEIKKRLDYELSVINKMGYSEYFLIIQDVIKEVSKIEGISTAGRGSSAGSVAAYCLGIHQIDPIKHDLLFERFLNPDRVSLPDIDTDFADKDVAVEYVKKKYGEDRVAMIGTFGTLAFKSAVKDASRALGISFDEVNAVTSELDNGIVIEDALNVPSVNQLFEKHKELLPIVRVIVDVVKFTGIHAAGICWGKEQITEYCPVRKIDNKIVTQYDMEELEAVGLVKFDFLGLETMNIIRNTLKMIGKDDNWLKNIPLDDKKTYDMLTFGDSCGVFQLASSSMVDVLKKVRPTCFDDIVAIVSLYRPGSLEYVDVYARRKHGEEEVVYDHHKLEPILKSTYGIIIFQEQLLSMVRVLAGFTVAKADVLRRGVGKKSLDLILSLKKEFYDGCKNYSGMSDVQINHIWDKIIAFANYSFNRSHGVSYSLSSYRTAYFRCYYPVEFMTAMINSEMGNIDKQVFYINEAKRRMGIGILSPDINLSDRYFTADGGIIRFGIEGIKNISGVSLEIIMANRPYVSFVDFINRVDLSKVNKRVQMCLIESGAFDSLGVNRHSLLAGYLDIVPKKAGKDKQLTLFGLDAGLVYDFPKRKEPNILEKIKMEKRAMGISASGDILDLFSEFDTGLPKDLNSGRVNVFGVVRSIRKVFTKKGNREMAFVTLGNRDGQIEVVVFPNQYSVYGNFFYEDAGVFITGSLQNNSLIADLVELVKVPGGD